MSSQLRQQFKTVRKFFESIDKHTCTDYPASVVSRMVMEREPVYVFAYIRVSTLIQGDKFSPEVQKRMIREFAERYNMIVLGFYEDKQSGKSIGRTALFELLDEIPKHKKVHAIITPYADRISRQWAHSGPAQSALRKAGVEFISMDTFNPGSESTFMDALFAVLAEEDNRKRSKRAQQGISERMRQGYFCGHAPFGYVNAKVDRRNQIVPHPEKSKTVQRIFELAINSDLALNEIRRKVKAEGYNVDGLPIKLFKVLKNPAYKGSMRVRKGKEDEAILPANHPAIISDALWERANKIRNTRSKPKLSLPADVATEPLSGLILCPNCTNKVLNLNRYVSSTKAQTVYSYLRCRSCSFRTKVDDVWDKIDSVISALHFREERLALLQQHVSAEIARMRASETNQISHAKTEIDGLKTRLTDIEEDFFRGTFDAQQYADLSRKLKDRIDEKSHALAQAETRLEDIEHSDLSVLKVLSQIHEHFENGNSNMRIRIVQALLGQQFSPLEISVTNSIVDFMFDAQPARTLGSSMSVMRTTPKTGQVMTITHRKRQRRVSVWRKPRQVNNLEGDETAEDSHLSSKVPSASEESALFVITLPHRCRKSLQGNTLALCLPVPARFELTLLLKNFSTSLNDLDPTTRRPSVSE